MREAFVAILVFGLTASCRFLALNGFPDDHYVQLAGAQQMLHGAWPSRDFVDLGAPLIYALSAGAQQLLGEGQLAEAVLMAVVFGIAAVLTLRAGVALTGSIAAAFVAVFIEVVIFPRTYSYTKILIYATAALALIWYANRPSRVRIVALAALAVIALLIRHDHGLYIGLASLAAVALSPAPNDRFSGMSVAIFCAAVVLLSVPYLVYLQAADGVIAHVQRAAEYTALETTRQRLSFGGRPLHETWLLLLAWLAPFASFALIAVRCVRLSEDGWMWARRVAPLVVLALIANAGLIRDQLETRLPDAIVPPALLLAWLTRQAWVPARWLWSAPLRLASLAVVAMTMWSVTVMGHTPEQLDRIGVHNGVDRLPERFAERARELRRPWEGRQTPSQAARSMRAFFDYSDRCLPIDARVLNPNFLPEITVLARRPFAGGQVWFMPRTMTAARDHARVMERLARERVLVAVLRRPTYDEIALEFPELDAFIMEHFTPIDSWALGGDDRIILLADLRAATGMDRATGWPCFR